MNHHLQNIATIIQQDDNLPAEQKNAILKSLKEADKELEITLFKFDRTEQVKKTTAILLEETIAELEEKRKAVEAQNRELEIEASLERVRVVALSMNKPGEILNICEVIFNELRSLGFRNLRNALINFWDDENGLLLDYDYSDFSGGNFAKLSYDSDPVFESFQKKIRQSKDAFAELIIEGSQLEGWKQRRINSGEYDDPRLDEISALHYYFYSTGVGALGISTFGPITTEQLELLKRFRNVFNLSYQRYADIAKAEAQATEARIETALERVRAVAMSMKRSEDLFDVCKVMYNELTALNFTNMRNAQIAINLGEYKSWMIFEYSEYGEIKMKKVDSSISPLLREIAEEMSESKDAHRLFKKQIKGEEFENWRAWRIKEDALKDPRVKKANSMCFYLHGIEAGILGISSFDTITNEQVEILSRFKNVFDLSYRRYADVANAEAQAKEAQIETALEKVRSRSLAMHKSDELQDVVHTVFEKLKELNVELYTAIIIVFTEGSKDIVWWMENKINQQYPKIDVPYLDASYFKDLFEAKESGKDFFSKCYFSEEKSKLYKHLFEHTELKHVADDQKKFLLENEFATISVAFGKNTGIHLTRYSAKSFSDEDDEILRRFANVFDQAYTRFLDLQKAEAQAREAQIELSLERVRARAMAMQRSDELKDLIAIVSSELGKLDIVLDRCFIIIYDPKTNNSTWWMSNPETPSEPIGLLVRYHEHPPYMAHLQAWNKREVKWQYILEGETKMEWDKFLFVETGLAQLPDFVINNMRSKEKVYLSSSFNNFGCLTLATLEALSDEQFDIMLRFANVFDLTYTRFNDLQKAEAQSREAQIELGLERVRARAMAMQNSEELNELIGTVFTELTKLDFVLTRCVIMIYDLKTNDARWWMANSETPEHPMNFLVKHHELPPNIAYFKAWRERTLKFEYILQDEIKKEWDDFLFAETELSLLPDFVIAGMRAPGKVYLNASFNNFGNLTLASLEPLSNEHFDILLRFAKVFDLTYTRFNDLKQAEAQARESQIQLALERVRARTMAMQKSNELMETAVVLFDQLSRLGENIERAIIGVVNEEERVVEVWATRPDGSQMDKMQKFPIDEPIVMQKIYIAWQQQQRSIVIDLRGEELERYFQFLQNRSTRLKRESFGERRIENFVFFSKGILGIINADPDTPADLGLYERFAAVFDQTYTRFLDLQKVEAQARESQIQLALERVRAKTMAMQRSNELPAAANLLFHQIQTLGMPAFAAGYCTWEEEHKAITLWMSSEGILQPPFKAPTTEDELFIQMRKGYEQGKSLHVVEMGGEKLVEHYQYMRTLPVVGGILDSIIEAGHPLPAFQIMHQAYFSKGFLLFITYQPVPESHELFERFALVFDQTYTRFLDLKKAEAQAREAQIEAALEKVRSRSLAMHKSEELQEVATTIYERLTELNVKMDSVNIAIFKEGSRDFNYWVASPYQKRMESFCIPYSNLLLTKDLVAARESGTDFFGKAYSFEEKNEWFNYAFRNTDFKFLSEERKQMILNEKAVTISIAFSKNTGVQLARYSHELLSEDEIEILKRFSKVFEQAYIRFLDLQKAEAQAREATIDAALEKVRGKAMAMHTSSDISVTASLVFTELRKLGIAPIRCGVGLLHKESRKGQLYSATSSAAGDSLSLVGWAELSGHPVLKNIYDSWEKNEEYYPEMSGEQLQSYYKSLLKGIAVPVPEWKEGEKQYGSFLPFSVGCLYAWSNSPYNDAEIKILKRFAAIIDLTFRRYVEIQKSELSAKEAIKQSALDRVRAEIASMRTINDLDRITPLIWNELTILGVPFIRCGVFIMDDSQQLIHTFLSTPDGKAIGAFHLPYGTPGNIGFVLSHWQDKKRYIDHWSESAFVEFAETLVKQGALDSPEEYLKTIPHGGFYLHFLPFLQGMLYVGNSEQLGEEEIILIQAVADAFSTAYARYEDFNKLEAAKQQVDKTLTELKQAQQQLVQSEKMACLGELTAGIAHEIQNPLNFVNNFSEVNAELIDELQDEIGKGNLEEIKLLARDIKENEEKINHHGKRADAIVKGMLQHSRNNSGVKEPTDINELVDEYLRLSYHGLRAKDNSFNAIIKTEFDAGIGKLNLVHQEIGRALLNLLTNAFYAVNERKKDLQNGFEPTVFVSTKKTADKIIIAVKDNGKGIPEKVLDKIFQPFFTTKPTGQGTGLGLSLSYDIVKAHGGELKVQTTEGESTEFIIQLPLS